MTRRASMLLGVDAIFALLVACALLAVTSDYMPVNPARDFYSVSASVLSIVFSVFTASLAVIVASPDDRFVRFLENEGFYGDILFGFQATLGALFFALVYSIVAYTLSTFQLEMKVTRQHRSGFIVGAALLAYALGATLTSAYSAIRYAQTKASFLRKVV